MNCKYFGECGSCTLSDMSYEEQKQMKIKRSQTIFGDLGVNSFLWHPSLNTQYRARAEFEIWHDDDKISYTMYKKDEKSKLKIDSCPKVCKQIFELMPKLLFQIQSDKILKEKLFCIEFLCTRKDVLVTLIYHKNIDESWDLSAKNCAKKLSIKLIGRSKGVKRVLDEDFVMSKIIIKEREFNYKIYDGSFMQPNRGVNEQMLNWAFGELSKTKRRDLLELYCGYGNFTIPLSSLFDNVLATEISKKSFYSANENTKLNKIDNISFVRLSAQELVQAFNKVREFNRLKDINIFKYNFSHILVDPPRAGLDDDSLKLASSFKNIIYFSCNQDSLKRDLKKFELTHEIKNFALFDQFPYTYHIESAVILKKKSI